MLTMLPEGDKSYGTTYRVWTGSKDDHKSTQVLFTGVLENIDLEYYYFEVRGVIAHIRKDFICMMIPLENPKRY